MESEVSFKTKTTLVSCMHCQADILVVMIRSHQPAAQPTQLAEGS